MKQPANVEGGCEYSEKAVDDSPLGQGLPTSSSDLTHCWNSHRSDLIYPSWTFLSASVLPTCHEQGEIFWRERR